MFPRLRVLYLISGNGDATILAVHQDRGFPSETDARVGEPGS